MDEALASHVAMVHPYCHLPDYMQEHLAEVLGIVPWVGQLVGVWAFARLAKVWVRVVDWVAWMRVSSRGMGVFLAGYLCGPGAFATAGGWPGGRCGVGRQVGWLVRLMGM